jgi:hypothetical protein
VATRTIIQCDACGVEIKEPSRMIEFTATLFRHDVAVEKFDISQFCGRQCVINAVNALLNGAP